MFKFLLIALAILAPNLATSAPPQDRSLGITTQDKNGLFVVVVTSNKGEAKIGVTEFSDRRSGETEVSTYSGDRFEDLWLISQELGLKDFTAGTPSDIGAGKNYVITIGWGGKAAREMYLVPKCSAPQSIVSFVERLTEGFLPAGSPGLMRPCSGEETQAEG